jgi:putative restriction endonuclease
MFDRGLLSVADDQSILLSNHINDVDGVRKILNASGRARLPDNPHERPDPQFLQWHREHCFKGVVLS